MSQSLNGTPKKVLMKGVRRIEDASNPQDLRSPNTTNDLLPILDQYPKISPEEITRMSYNTGKGFFLTFGITRDAFKHRWIPKQGTGQLEQLTPKQLSLFAKAMKKYAVKNIIMDAIGKARAYGQSVVFMVHKDPDDPASEYELRSIKYDRFNLIFEGKGRLRAIRAPVIFGNIGYIVEVPIENCVLFINGVHETGYPYLGRSELSAPYYYIRASLNIMDNWVKLFSQRGLGLLDLKIKNATMEDLDRAETLYSDPTQFSALIHDDNVEVTTIQGISAGYSIKETNEMFMKEVSSASGISYTKLDGGNTYVSGVIADQDNYAANFQLLHQQWHDTIVKVIEMVEPRLKDKLSLDFEIEIKLDKTQMIQVQSTFLTMVLTCPEIFSLNDLLRGLGMEIQKDGEDITVAEYLYGMRKKIYGPEMFQRESPVEGGSENDLFHERVGKNDENVKGNVNLNLKNARKELKNKKRNIAKSLIMQIKTTPYAAIGDSIVLDLLKKMFGESISKETLQEIKQEVNDEIKARPTLDFPEILKFVKDSRPELPEEEVVAIAWKMHSATLGRF